MRSTNGYLRMRAISYVLPPSFSLKASVVLTRRAALAAQYA
jgi:hypothetical protein